jgi:hypothetical protein
MPALIISRVEAIVTREKQTDTMVFMDRHGNPLEEYESEEIDEEDDDDLEPDIIAGVDEQSNNDGNPPGLLLEIPGVGESKIPGMGKSAGVYNETPGVDQKTPGVYPELDALAKPEADLNKSDGTDAIQAGAVTSDEIVNDDDDDDEPPPMGGQV